MADPDQSQTQTLVRRRFTSTGGVSEKKYTILHSADLKGWNTRKIPTYQIYRQTFFSRLNFLKYYKIKTSEASLALENKPKDIYLLSRDEIREYRSNYKFLHIGLVQVSLGTRGFHFDGKIKVSLRNSKKSDIKESILATFESDLCHGPMKFNWFTNFSTALSDLGNSNALVITVEPYDSTVTMPAQSQPLKIDFRMCYKLMKNSLKPHSLFESPVLEINTEKIEVLYQT